jgi:excisionase family DNA binding protein
MHAEHSKFVPGRVALSEAVLLVSPAAAMTMLSCGRTRLYELLDRGELESFLDGRARRITVASVHAYIARKLEESRKAA